MKLAVLTDIHGNLSALESVLEHVSGTNVDQIIVAGDAINMHPDSKACWDLIQNEGFICLRGNHERYVFDYGTPNALPEWSEERFKLLAWMQAQFSDTDLMTMRSLPLSLRFNHLLITHAGPLNDQAAIYKSSSDNELELLFPDAPKLIIRGHQHHYQEKNWAKGKIITLGSLGIPVNETGKTQYHSLELRASGWHAKHHLLPYDRTSALEKMDQTYLENAGPLGAIFRLELETARAQVMPFFKEYWKALEGDELSLQDAVRRYLAS